MVYCTYSHDLEELHGRQFASLSCMCIRSIAVAVSFPIIHLSFPIIHSLVLAEVLNFSSPHDVGIVRWSGRQCIINVSTQHCTGHREYYYFSMLQEPATSLMPLKLRTGGGSEGPDSR